MNDRKLVGTCVGRASLSLTLAGAGVLSSCASPFGPDISDYGPVTPIERLRTIASFSIDEFSVPETPEDEIEDLVQPLEDPYAGFDSVEVSVQQARAWALENNLDLQVSLVDPTIARERLSQEEAKFESTFNASIAYTDTDQPTASDLDDAEANFWNINTGVSIPLRTGGRVTVDLPWNRTETNNEFATLNPSYETDVALSYSQPLLRNAGRRVNSHSIRIQALETQISESRAKLEIIRELATVDRAYWLLYASQRQLEVAQEQYELAVEQLERAERRVRAQVAPEVEIVRAQDGVASRLEDIIIAENRVRDTQRNLKRLMNVPGLEMGTQIVLMLASEPDPVRYELNAESLTRAAVANRMEMLELELRLAQDYSSIDFERNQALPSFLLDFSYSPQGLGDSYSESLDTLRRNSFADWSVAARVEVPIGNEAAEARVHQAILRRLQRLASKAARALSIRQEVFDTVDGLNAGWQRVLATRQSTILAARTLRAEQNQFDVGARTSTDVLDAATRLADAQTAEIVALTNYQIAQVDLAFATGTLLGQAKVDWEPRDPRGSGDFVGERRGRVPLGPQGVAIPDQD